MQVTTPHRPIHFTKPEMYPLNERNIGVFPSSFISYFTQNTMICQFFER